MYYIGLDIHKKSISFCVKDASGQIYQQGKVAATRRDLDAWMKTLPQPWTGAMEATIFTGWIYVHLKPHGAAVKVAHPLMLRAIAASKKKNDRIDASKIADCLRCDFLPECYMDSLEIRERRRLASLLMETGVSYDRQQLHRLGFVSDLLGSEDVTNSIRPLLRVSQDSILRLRQIESALIRSLEREYSPRAFAGQDLARTRNGLQTVLSDARTRWRLIFLLGVISKGHDPKAIVPADDAP